MKYLTLLIALLLPACTSITPQQQQAITAAGQIASMAVQIYASAPGSKLNSTQAAAVQNLIAATTANPQAAAIASNSLYGGAAMAQAGVPVAQGASAPSVGTAIVSAVPSGLTANQQAALLQAAAAFVAKPVIPAPTSSTLPTLYYGDRVIPGAVIGGASIVYSVLQ